MNFPEQPENPYAATVPQTPYDPNAMPGSSGLVNQVMVVGILQIVFGAMELLMGGFLLFYAVFFAVVMPNMPKAGREPSTARSDVLDFYWFCCGWHGGFYFFDPAHCNRHLQFLV